MKYKLQLFGKRLQIYAGFPQVWIFIFLVFAAVLFYYLSIKVCDEYYKSLFTNVFSGLLTGLVLSALSGSRQVYIAKQEKKYEWLKQLHERIMDYKKMRSRFLVNDFGEYDRDGFIYDMGAHASWINEFIKIGVSDKRIHFNPIDELANSLQVCLDSGAKKVLLPITSAGDLGVVPAELIGCFNLIFYSSAEDAVFKALGVE